jgi:CRP-like cAMP-binding protein
VLLATLGPEDWLRWAPFFERVPILRRDQMIAPDETIRHLWFPEGGLYSQIVETSSGNGVEVRLIGREGLIGLAGALGVDRSSMRAIAHSDATALRIRAATFHELCDNRHSFSLRIERYAVAAMESFAHIAACNQLHHVDQRLCRWLLTAHRRIGETAIPITQESLALLLGTRRASVSDAIRALQSDGLVHCGPGRIAVRDAAELHRRACECYDAIEALFALR